MDNMRSLPPTMRAIIVTLIEKWTRENNQPLSFECLTYVENKIAQNKTQKNEANN